MANPLPAWCRIVRDRDAATTAVLKQNGLRVSNPRDAAAVIHSRIGFEEVEVVSVLLLNAQHKLVDMAEVTRGLVNSSLIHPREVFRLAIAMNATAIILGHNHPSGDTTPSAEDRAVTDQLVMTGRILDIPVHDHVIVGTDPSRFTSFAEAGLL